MTKDEILHPLAEIRQQQTLRGPSLKIPPGRSWGVEYFPGKPFKSGSDNGGGYTSNLRLIYPILARNSIPQVEFDTFSAIG